MLDNGEEAVGAGVREGVRSYSVHGKQTLDTTKGAKVVLSADNPKITTAPTKPGLTYTLREGATLDGMKDGDSTIGNGQQWSPKITVRGGNSAFYSIGVGKGESAAD